MTAAAEQKHTPGPWKVGAIGNGTPGYVYCDNALGSAVAIAYGDSLAFTVFSRAEEEANARLIAAAPDLLSVVKEVQQQCLFDDDDGIGVSEDVVVPSDMFNRICAAINKAVCP